MDETWAEGKITDALRARLLSLGAMDTPPVGISAAVDILGWRCGCVRGLKMLVKGEDVGDG